MEYCWSLLIFVLIATFNFKFKLTLSLVNNRWLAISSQMSLAKTRVNTFRHKTKEKINLDTLVRHKINLTWNCGIKFFSLQILVGYTLPLTILDDDSLSSLSILRNSRWRPRCQKTPKIHIYYCTICSLRGCQLSKTNTCIIFTCIKKNGNFSKETGHSWHILVWVIQTSNTYSFMPQTSALEGSASRLSALFKSLPGLIPLSSVWHAG